MNPVDRAYYNWRRVIRKVIRLSKGYRIPSAQIMMEKHWLEAQFMYLRVGDVRVFSRIHRNSIPKNVVRAYQALNNRTIRFNDFVQEAIHSWSEEEQRYFLRNLRFVKYFSDEAMSHLKVDFTEDGSIIMPDSYLAHFVEEEDEEGSFENYIKTVHDLPPKLLPEGEYICILTPEREFRIAHKVGDTYHSSLSRGTAVLFSGKIQIIQHCGKNVITSVNVNSGHYRLGRNEMDVLLEFLNEKGVDTDALEIDVRQDPPREIERDSWYPLADH